MANFRVVQERYENQIIPEGISLTETIMSYYLYIRTRDKIVRVCIVKEEGISSAQSINAIDGTEEQLI
jgi:hypothetical protein